MSAMLCRGTLSRACASVEQSFAPRAGPFVVGAGHLPSHLSPASSACLFRTVAYKARSVQFDAVALSCLPPRRGSLISGLPKFSVSPGPFISSRDLTRADLLARVLSLNLALPYWSCPCRCGSVCCSATLAHLGDCSAGASSGERGQCRQGAAAPGGEAASAIPPLFSLVENFSHFILTLSPPKNWGAVGGLQPLGCIFSAIRYPGSLLSRSRLLGPFRPVDSAQCERYARGAMSPPGSTT